MLGLLRKNQPQSQSGTLIVPEVNQSTRGYDRRATGHLSYDFVYRPKSFAHDMRSGGYGEPVKSDEVMQCLGNYPSEDFLGVTIIGTDAGRYLGKRFVNHFENYGFGHGFVFDVTTVVAIIPLSNAAGCGACPGNTIVVSPGYGFNEGLDTFYHEYMHNCGYDHKYGPNGEQLDTGNDPIYIESARVCGYLSSFPEG
jgi:hypothetical protein